MPAKNLRELARDFVSRREHSAVEDNIHHLEAECLKKAQDNYPAACQVLRKQVGDLLDRWNGEVKVFQEGKYEIFEAIAAPDDGEAQPGTEFSWFMTGQGFGSGEFTPIFNSPNREELVN